MSRTHLLAAVARPVLKQTLYLSSNHTLLARPT